MYRWIEDRAPYLLCAALWNRSSTLSSNDTYAEVPSAQCQKRKARLTFRTKKAGLSPHLFLREIGVGSMCRFKFPLSPFSPSAIFPFSPFLSPPSDRTRSLPSLPWRCVCVAGPLGDPTFFDPGHPTHSLGSPTQSRSLVLTLWGTLG